MVLMDKMKISIVTVNYNGAEDTINLLNIFKNQTDSDFELIVVENGSNVADIDRLNEYQKKHGWQNLVVIKNGQNLGFSGGCNVGIKKALAGGSKWVILINNDTTPEKDFIARLKAVLRLKRGVVSIPLDEGGHTAYAGLVKWLKPTLGHIYTPEYNGCLCGLKDSHCIQRGHCVSNIYAIGGGAAISSDVFEKIGLMDEDYFLYFEDADLSLTAAQAGFSIGIAEGVSINHKVSASTKKLGSPLLLRYHYRNALYFNRKFGPWWVQILLWPWSIWIIKKQIIKLIFGIEKERSQAILNGVFDFYKDKMGKIGN
ncbi:MAG TPA: hypothetical protein DCS06_03445 [Candidatus Yanofskybacteria bacterium]|uniref:Glycosyl transferase, family 2 n=1 Tax=Candidatus Yanofskybacteria bacterium GW2011_GWE2_40_11 TaxID=1619033 RepID=A0A0G0QM48_9BACT|nr:MAG: Glycosyl transferase, family 2 [Candidatus Yanofskybacteria bacterium GW2011_GWE2_40_11]OGN38545.1 MAG: hypothetical protein A2302_00515 [Candidatus Yanofskybacteria bacterium RIFOXYB2_FULL_44_18]HAU08004.1 hypothetical protein [Candidatus Yanofskybacteria bacterium]HBX58454.1 hypothetical protein [Candidatus Yanofskybacteria bacterium]